MAGKSLAAGFYGVTVSSILTVGLVFLLGMPVHSGLLYAFGLLIGAGVFASMGLMVSVSVREVFEAMTFMNFFRFPLLFVSGVFTPIESLPAWLRPLSWISPLTYVVDILRWAVSGKGYFSHPALSCGLAILCCLVFWTFARRIFYRNALQT